MSYFNDNNFFFAIYKYESFETSNIKTKHILGYFFLYFIFFIRIFSIRVFFIIIIRRIFYVVSNILRHFFFLTLLYIEKDFIKRCLIIFFLHFIKLIFHSMILWNQYFYSPHNLYNYNLYKSHKLHKSYKSY